jgi:L-lactate dehydrogenase complex protein LldG
MSARSDARSEILGRVRAALSGVEPAVDLPPSPRIAALPDHEALVSHFAERVADYRAVVVRCAPADVPARVVEALAGATRVVVPPGLPDDLHAAVSTAAATTTVDDGSLGARELDGYDAVVTEAAVGIAETGTIVLDHGPGQGRRAISLVPDLHVCVVRADQVVPDVPDALPLLAPARVAGRPLTWISGPSATSDIELDRVEGVHGPRTLHVVLVDRDR